jgi:E3 ubiquitin-protein ligase FANCL
MQMVITPAFLISCFLTLAMFILFSRSTDRSIKDNIEELIEIQLPLPSSSHTTESFSLECAICYSYHLDIEEQRRADGKSSMLTVTPDYYCPNIKCRRPYHSICLAGWLQSVPTTKNSFGTLFGTCAYCQSSISLKSPLV